jgi:hypothetical protein
MFRQAPSESRPPPLFPLHSDVYIDIHLDVHGGCFYPGCDVSQSNDLVSIASTLDFEIVLKHITLVFRQAPSES